MSETTEKSDRTTRVVGASPGRGITRAFVETGAPV
jgi:hypothetical protein